MGQQRGVLLHERWDRCDTCGVLYPLSKLHMQRGFLVCTVDCTDNLDVVGRETRIEEMLAAAAPTENMDETAVNRAWMSVDENEA